MEGLERGEDALDGEPFFVVGEAEGAGGGGGGGRGGDGVDGEDLEEVAVGEAFVQGEE